MHLHGWQSWSCYSLSWINLKLPQVILFYGCKDIMSVKSIFRLWGVSLPIYNSGDGGKVMKLYSHLIFNCHWWWCNFTTVSERKRTVMMRAINGHDLLYQPEPAWVCMTFSVSGNLPTRASWAGRKACPQSESKGKESLTLLSTKDCLLASGIWSEILVWMSVDFYVVWVSGLD